LDSAYVVGDSDARANGEANLLLVSVDIAARRQAHVNSVIAQLHLHCVSKNRARNIMPRNS